MDVSASRAASAIVGAGGAALAAFGAGTMQSTGDRPALRELSRSVDDLTKRATDVDPQIDTSELTRAHGSLAANFGGPSPIGIAIAADGVLAALASVVSLVVPGRTGTVWRNTAVAVALLGGSLAAGSIIGGVGKSSSTERVQAAMGELAGRVTAREQEQHDAGAMPLPDQAADTAELAAEPSSITDARDDILTADMTLGAGAEAFRTRLAAQLNVPAGGRIFDSAALARALDRSGDGLVDHAEMQPLTDARTVGLYAKITGGRGSAGARAEALQRAYDNPRYQAREGTRHAMVPILDLVQRSASTPPSTWAGAVDVLDSLIATDGAS